MNNRYILASASPRRREILAQVGISFEVMAGNVEEVITETIPERMVMELAALKSNDIRNKLQDNLCGKGYDNIYVIGADTMVFCNNIHMGKPSSYEQAFDMIRMLQGNTHQVITGVCVDELISGRQVTFAETTNVNVVPMSDSQIHEYIGVGESMDKAGAYAVQGYFSRYVKGIEGDYFNVVGFPVCRFFTEISRI